MRLAAALFFAACLTVSAARGSRGTTLTVLLEFEQKAPETSLDEMRRELTRLVEPAGVRLDVRLRPDVRPNETFEDLVVVTFKGSCGASQDPMLIDERGPAPLAYAHTSGSDVLPFTVVACDAVRRSVDSALWGSQRGQRDRFFGRALGRVLAHELLHVAGQTHEHGKSGVFRAALTGAQLTSERLDFSRADLSRMREARGSGAR